MVSAQQLTDRSCVCCVQTPITFGPATSSAHLQPFTKPDSLHPILAYSPAGMLQQYGNAAVSITAVLQPSSLINLKAPVLLAPTGVAVIPASLQASAVAFPFDTATSI